MNMLNEYKKTVERYIEVFKKDPNIVGIMHLGGIARGFADQHSDIDLALFSIEPLNIHLGE